MVGHQQTGISLRQAFDIHPGEVVSLVGGGGKTTLMFALASEIAASGEKVVTTTTTRIFEPSPTETFLIVEADENKLINMLEAALKEHRHITVAASRLPEGKLKGISLETVDRIAKSKVVHYIINEADGSARKPLKAPNATEPVIPQSSTLVIAVVGADAIGCTLSAKKVFRPEIVSQLTGLGEGKKVTVDTIAVLFTHAAGIIKGVPVSSRIIPVVNKVDVLPDLSAAESLAQKILNSSHKQISRVILSRLKDKKTVIKVIEL